MEINLQQYQTKPLGPRVPNVFPTQHEAYRIAIVGEAPGKDEEEKGEPFVGGSGRFLTALLIDSGINRRAVYVGNVTQYRPPQNDIKMFSWRGHEIQSGLEQLRADMLAYKPNLVVLLGASALRAAKGTWMDDKGKDRYYSIGDWRGSVFISDDAYSPFYGLKCLATYHPAAILRNYAWVTYARFDLKRAKREGSFPELVQRPLIVDVEPNLDTIIARLDVLNERAIPFSLDIEGGVQQGMSCLSISPTEQEAFIIPFTDAHGNSFWSFEEEVRLWEHLSRLLTNPAVPKCLQNAMYDRFVLAYSYRTLICNVKDDTMLKHWEKYAELEKSLAVQTSIYTDVPYYKDERHAGSLRAFWTYCCKDSIVTQIINNRLEKALTSSSYRHYRTNVDLLNPFLYIELRGMQVDIVKRNQKIQQLEGLANFTAKGKKKTSGGSEQLKLEEMVGWQVNVNSRLDMIKLLYEQLKAPAVYKERKNGEETLTADYETLLRFAFRYQNEDRGKILFQVIKVRQLRKRASDLRSLTTDPDGRIRSSTNVVGTETGRTSSSEAPTGNGTNLQTVTSDDRDVIIADPDHDFCQCDLAGADGWTVAAWCAHLQDPTMLEDYRAGLKPAKVIALLYLHGEEVNTWDRAKIKAMSKHIDAETDKTNNFLYFASKRIQHGTNYGMGPEKVVLQIFLDTEGAAIVPIDVAMRLQDLYRKRYPGVERLQTHIANTIKQTGQMLCASGHTRLFFGRKDDHATIRAAYSQEPQHNTTYATNLALLSLWNDPENRKPNGDLIIWPCHQVHDALCVQWPTARREWAMQKMRQYFNNKLTIAGQEIVIPFEGHIGPSWGEHSIEFGL